MFHGASRGRARPCVVVGSMRLGLRSGYRGDALKQLGFREHAEADGGDLSGEGLSQKNGGYLADLQGGGNAVVRAGIGETRQRTAVHADGDDLDAVTGLEGCQRRCEGMAIRAVRAVEEEQHVILAQIGNGARAIHQFGLVEDFKGLGIDWAALQGWVELRCGPGHALCDIGEVGGAGDDLGLQFHVAPDIGFAGSHDGDIARLFQGFLEVFEFDQLRCPRRLSGRRNWHGLAWQ
jgi:hypothetical protein